MPTETKRALHIFFKDNVSTAEASGGRARTMIQQLRALAALGEDLGLVLIAHMVAHNHLELQFYGI